MKPKERLLAGITGKPVDHISWSPFLTYWWENSPDKVIQAGEVGFLKSIGADPLIRGHFAYQPGSKRWDDMNLFCESYVGGCSKTEKQGNDTREVIYSTPIGNLNFVYKYSASGDTWFLQEHGVKSEEDFKILKFLKENTVLTPNFERFNKEAEELGDDGLMVPILVPESKSAFQSLVEYWVGTENLTYAIYDYPEIVEETLSAMWKLNMKAVEICAESAAECFITWEDTSTTNISPAMYEQYVVLEINNWCDYLHKKGKLYIQHACGHLKHLLPIMAKSKIDAIESISPVPTGNIVMKEARQILPEHIALIGGIEAVNFKELQVDELKKYAQDLITDMKGSRFVLANSDSCPPHVELEKFHMLGELASASTNQ